MCYSWNVWLVLLFLFRCRSSRPAGRCRGRRYIFLPVSLSEIEYFYNSERWRYVIFLWSAVLMPGGLRVVRNGWRWKGCEVESIVVENILNFPLFFTEQSFWTIIVFITRLVVFFKNSHFEFPAVSIPESGWWTNFYQSSGEDFC